MRGLVKVLEQGLLSATCQNMKEIAQAFLLWQFWREETVINAGTNSKSDFSTAFVNFPG